jgi:hypothetical protein
VGLYGVSIVLGHPAAAVCVGIVVMLALVMREYRHGAVNIVDCTSLSFFVLALLTIATTGHDLFSIYRTIAAWDIFAVVARATLVAGFPFTLQYARERAPREIWNGTAFLTMECDYDVGMGHHFHDGHDPRNARSSPPLRSITRGGDPKPSPWYSATPSIISTQSNLRKRIDIASANVRSGNYVGKN